MSQLQVQLGLMDFAMVAGVLADLSVRTASWTRSSGENDRSHSFREMSSVKTSNELSRHHCEIG